MSDHYAPEMADPGDGDMFGAFASAICDAGHEWADAGGDLLICTVCQAEKWADSHAPRKKGRP